MAEGVKTIALTAGASAPESWWRRSSKFLEDKGFQHNPGSGGHAGERPLRPAAGDRGSNCCRPRCARSRCMNGKMASPFPARSSRKMRFGKIEDMPAAWPLPLDGARKYLFSAAARRWLLVRRTGSRHHARIRLHPAATLLGTGDPGRMQKRHTEILRAPE